MKTTKTKPAVKAATKSQAIGLRIDDRLRDYLERRAEREGRSISNLVCHLLTQIAEKERWR